MNNNQIAFIAMGLMVALAFVVVGASNVATPVTAAKPSGVPPAVSRCGDFQGPETGSCAQAIHPTGPP
jgi:hypothetical protein